MIGEREQELTKYLKKKDAVIARLKEKNAELGKEMLRQQEQIRKLREENAKLREQISELFPKNDTQLTGK